MLTGADRWADMSARVRDRMPPLPRLLAWTVAVGVTCYSVRALVYLDSWSYALVWPAIAPQIVALLTSPRRQWPVYIASFAAIQIVPARLLLDMRPEVGVLATMTAVVVAAAFLHRDQEWVSGRSDSLTSWRRFLVYGVFLAPLLASPIGLASLMWNAQVGTDARSVVGALMAWYLTEAIGIAFLVPVMLRWRRYTRRHSWREVLWFAAMTVLTIGLCAASATKSSFVLVFLTGLPALLVLIRSGIAAALAEMAIASALVLGSTFAGYGPFAASIEDAGQAMVSAQVFLLGAYAMVVIVAAALEDRMQLVALDDASHNAYDLVAELTGDVVILVDSDGNVLHRAHGGEQSLDIPDGPITRERWLRHIHPQDRVVFQNRWDPASEGPSAPFRIRRVDGSWGWYVVHSRRTGVGLSAAVLRDVTLEREVQESLTDMANTDPLTGLLNRRGLALHASEICVRANESGQQVAALFVDVDHFKAYNDHYGHHAGDACLRDVADVLLHLGDLDTCVSARYGGEEFAVVLVGCEDPYSFAVGLSSAIRALAIPHPVTPSGVVTISIGVAAAHPRHELRIPGADPQAIISELLDRADRALYEAKSDGRNTISVADIDTVLIGEQIHHAGEHPREAAGGGHDE